MRDNKAGFVLNASLLSTAVLTAAAAVHLFAQGAGAIVNYCMVPIGLTGMLLTYLKNTKMAAWVTGGLFAALAAFIAIFRADQLTALLFWLVWTPLTLWSVEKLRTGVNGIQAERDFYRAECARIAMIDPITQMRSYHAFLNDAPIYIKIAKRYHLSMAVMVIQLNEAQALKDELDEVIYHEMLEGLSRAIRGCIRLEDLAYLVNNEAGTWCINMFTNLDMISVVIERLKNGMRQIVPKREDDTPCPLTFSFGYAAFSDENECTPATLFQQAVEMANQEK